MDKTTFWQRQAPGGAVLCGIPVIGGSGGVPMQSSFLPGLPGLAQSLAIAALLAGFVAAGIWMFKRWGGAGPGPAHAGNAGVPVEASAPEVTPDVWEELERELTATDQRAPTPSAESREPAGV